MYRRYTCANASASAIIIANVIANARSSIITLIALKAGYEGAGDYDNENENDDDEGKGKSGSGSVIVKAIIVKNKV